MAFEVRCKTAFGPFSSPELLDLKAPPAVHTAQSRIAAWNRGHNLDVAEHVGTRQPIKGRAGPAQYEVHYSSRLLTCAVMSGTHLQAQPLAAGSAARDTRQHWLCARTCQPAQPQASCMSRYSPQAAAAGRRFWSAAGTARAPQGH